MARLGMGPGGGVVGGGEVSVQAGEHVLQDEDGGGGGVAVLEDGGGPVSKLGGDLFEVGGRDDTRLRAVEAAAKA